MEKTLLIVDDVEFTIEFEKLIVQDLEHELSIKIKIDTAQTVVEALILIEQHPSRYDAMIIDMNLPDGSGVEIAKYALNKSEETRISALTIYPSKYQDESCFFDRFLQKPITPNAYKENLIQLLRL
jgi:CheY-like chemotaxis protein